MKVLAPLGALYWCLALLYAIILSLWLGLHKESSHEKEICSESEQVLKDTYLIKDANSAVICAPGFWLQPIKVYRRGIFYQWHHIDVQKL